MAKEPIKLVSDTIFPEEIAETRAQSDKFWVTQNEIVNAGGAALVREGVLDHLNPTCAADKRAWERVKEYLVTLARDGYWRFATTGDIKKTLLLYIDIARTLLPGVLDALIEQGWERHKAAMTALYDEGGTPWTPPYRMHKLNGPATYAEQIGYVFKNPTKKNKPEWKDGNFW